MATKQIDRFEGKHRFLSNFAPAKVIYAQMVFPTVEHAYQAAKSANRADMRYVGGAQTPGEAKKRGQRVKLRDDWEHVKEVVMRDLLEAKFSDPAMRKALLDTRDAELIEGNTWGDVYWGVCKGKGRNRLGHLLMAIRERCRSEGPLL